MEKPSMRDPPDRVKAYLLECARKKIGDLATTEALDEAWASALDRTKQIIAALRELKAEAEASDEPNKIFRVIAYAKAIKALSGLPVPVMSGKQATKLPGVGKKMGDKIDEILATGKLRTLEERSEAQLEKSNALRDFKRIWGVGDAQANRWFAEGKRSIADLAPSDLTATQKIALRHLEDLELDVERAEAREIYDRIREALASAPSLPPLKIELVGSWRRGAMRSKDVDFLVTTAFPTGDDKPKMKQIVEVLIAKGIVVDVLTSGSLRFTGIVRLHPKSPARHVDLLWTPYEDWGAALMHFTGSKDFNTDIRKKAAQADYRLSEKGLYKLKYGNGEDEKIPTVTEEDIFDELGINYVSPSRR